ncbi:Cold shock protein [Rickettsiales bacterium Ac37b]|nr:Cold shock protein [Rickettsiales bacterium Ac37b]
MATGTVKWFSHIKAFGFIEPDQKSNDANGKDIFVHAKALQASGINTLKQGDRISYELANERGKTAAVQLKILSE